MRLVGPNGEQVGIVRIEDALRLATESELDLVEVAPQAKPPVCKLMDFGKYKYEAAVKAREARKNQTNTVLKEIRFRLKIDKHDYETKRGHALRFLAAGDKVKAMIQFRGREQQRPEMGIRLLQKFAEDVAEVGVIESTPRIDGRNMVMVIGPTKNKAEAKAEARRAAQKADAKAANEAGKQRVDTSDDQAPMTQSLGDLLPEGLAAMGSQSEETAEAPAEQAAPAVAETEAPAVVTPEEPAAAAPEAKTEEQPETKPAAAPKAEPAAESKPAAAPKAEPAAAPKAKPAAEPKPAAAPKAEPAAESKPAAAPKAKPAAEAKPAVPAKPAAPAEAKPAAPKPAARPKPVARPAAPKPAGRSGSKS